MAICTLVYTYFNEDTVDSGGTCRVYPRMTRVLKSTIEPRTGNRRIQRPRHIDEEREPARKLKTRVTRLALARRGPGTRARTPPPWAHGGRAQSVTCPRMCEAFLRSHSGQLAVSQVPFRSPFPVLRSLLSSRASASRRSCLGGGYPHLASRFAAEALLAIAEAPHSASAPVDRTALGSA